MSCQIIYNNQKYSIESFKDFLDNNKSIFLQDFISQDIEGFKEFVGGESKAKVVSYKSTDNLETFVDENEEPTFEAVSMYLLNSKEEVKPGVIEKEGSVSFTTDNPLFNKCAK